MHFLTNGPGIIINASDESPKDSITSIGLRNEFLHSPHLAKASLIDYLDSVKAKPLIERRRPEAGIQNESFRVGLRC